MISNSTMRLQRKAVYEALSRIFHQPLSLIVAPMGYGKTIGMKEYLSNSAAEWMWVAITNSDENSFWKKFCAAFAQVNKTLADKLLALGLPTETGALGIALEIIGEAFFETPTALVLDDYQLISSSTIDSFIEALLKEEKENLYIVLISRQRPNFDIPSLEIKGVCYCVPTNVFEFSKEDIGAYFVMCGLNVSAEDIERIYSYTEGWISGIYLFHLQIEKSGALGSLRAADEMIEKNIYAHLNFKERHLLSALSLFEDFSLKQAVFIVGEHALKILPEMEVENRFIRYDSENEKYSMHNIIQQFFRIKFDKLSKASQKQVFQKAAQWFDLEADFLKAMSYYIEAKEYGEALETFAKSRLQQGLHDKDIDDMCRLYKQIPLKARTNHPYAHLVYTFELFMDGKIAEYLLESQLLKTNVSRRCKFDAKTKNTILAELEIVASLTKYNDIALMAAHHKKAAALLKSVSRVFVKESTWTAGNVSVLYMFHRSSGRLQEEVALMEECMPGYSKITSGNGTGADIQMKAEQFFNIGDFGNAQIYAHRAAYVTKEAGQVSIFICAGFLLCQIAMITGNFKQIDSILKDLREYSEAMRDYMLFSAVDICKGFIYASLGDTKQIPLWLRQATADEVKLYTLAKGAPDIVIARSLLLSENYLKLLALAEPFQKKAAKFNNVLGIIYAKIYQAAANHKIRRDKEAQDALMTAIALAAPDALIMPFVYNFDYIANFLPDCQKNHPEFCEKITKFGRSWIKVRSKYHRKPESVLAPRELEIAGLIVSGLTRAEVGAKLFISEATVKKALSSIYVKLEVRSRAALVVKMDELGLLDSNNNK